jgi:hypothetical protein
MTAVTGFLPFFSIAIEHGYFAGGPLPSAEWEPTRETTLLMRQSGCRVAGHGATLAVFAEEARLRALQSCLRQPFVLTWRLRISDPAFDGYTGGQPAERDRVLFLSSTGAVEEAPGKSWRLHAGAEVDAAQFLKFDDPKVKALLTQREKLLRPAPIVQLVFGPDDAPVPGAVPPGKGKHFRLRFAARATLWKYFLFGPWEAAGIEVVDAAREAQFAGAKAARLPDGRTTLTVRSVAPIALQQRPTQRFSLRSRDDGQDLIERLPFASPGSFGASEEGLPVSEIYV